VLGGVKNSCPWDIGHFVIYEKAARWRLNCFVKADEKLVHYAAGAVEPLWWVECRSRQKEHSNFIVSWKSKTPRNPINAAVACSLYFMYARDRTSSAAILPLLMKL
jgi:hypothetical protein